MTITEIVDLVCDKQGRADTDTKTLMKSLVKKRYQIIYNSTLWLDTLATVSETVVAGTSDVVLSSDPDVFYYHNATVTAGTAPRVDMPIAVRLVRTGDADGHMVTPSDWWTFFQINPNELTNDSAHQSTPGNFINLARNASGYSRIRLVPSPDVGGTLLVLGKLAFAEPADSDSPVIRGIDNILIAYAEMDLLEHTRQYGKAQVKLKEAGDLLGVAKDMQRNQTAGESRLIPWEPAPEYNEEIF